MSKENIIWCGAMYILGQLFHVFVQKIPALKKRAKAANYGFKMSDYWREEWNLVFAALIFGVMLVVGAGEIVTWKPEVADFLRWFFGFVGYFFNSMIIGKLGQYEKKLSRIIDIKTNTADDIAATDDKGKPVSMKTPAPGERNT